MPYYVYILANGIKGTLYVGVTNDLVRSVQQHRMELADGFTKKYGVKSLVHYEPFDDVNDAIGFEKRLKRWRRAWKIELVERTNRGWRDLFDDLNP
jgi:putative endonuclease